MEVTETRRKKWPEDYGTPAATDGRAMCPKCECKHLFSRPAPRALPTCRRVRCRNCGHEFTITGGAQL